MTAPKYYYNLNRCISDGKTQFDTTNMPKETYEVNGQIYSGSNELMDLLNNLHEENKQLLCTIVEILDFIEDKREVSMEEMRRWWKEKEKELMMND